MSIPRVAYVCADPGVPVFGRKGCSIHVQEVVRALQQQGVEVSLFAARGDGSPPPDLKRIVLHRLPCPEDATLAARERCCWEANNELRRQLGAAGPFDFVYERYSLWSLAGMEFARARRIPGLLEVNAPLIEEQARHRGLVAREQAEQVADRAFGNATSLLAVSDEIARYLCARGVPAKLIQVFPNAVDPGRFPSDLAAARIWPAGGATFTVGFVGTLKPWHGVAILLEAFAQLHQQHPQARLLIVGDGPERAGLETLVQKLGLSDVTRFTGAVAADEIPRLLAALDVAVAPYPPLEDFYFSPLKAYEYLAAGRATVASRLGQLKHLIQHEQNGLLAEPGDVADLTRQLLRLYEDGNLRDRIAAAGRQTILEHHTWDHLARRILKLARLERPSAEPRSDRDRSAKIAPANYTESVIHHEFR